MSTATMRLRRAGAGGLAAAVVAGTLVATAGAAFAAPSPFAVAGVNGPTTVYVGGTAQAGDDIAITMPAAWSIGDTVTFNLPGDCAAAATTIGLSGTPTATAALATGAASTDVLPKFSIATSTGTATGCTAAGVNHTFTLTLTNDASAQSTSPTITITNVAYNVGSGVTAPFALNLAWASAGTIGVATGNVPSANVANTKFSAASVVPVTASATAAVTGIALSSMTAADVASAHIATPISFTLSAGVWTAGSTPTLTGAGTWTLQAPAAGPPATGLGTDTIIFTSSSTLPTTANTYVLSGAKMDLPAATTGTVTVTASYGTTQIGAPATVASAVYQTRIGGSDRYATAAALYNAKFGTGIALASRATSVVVTTGALFPDALSGNFLAKQYSTGILLTQPTVLPSVTLNALVSNPIATVYILGGTGAVSQSVENQIAALHVSNTSTNPFINVVRIGGADRYATNQLANEYNFATHATAVIATGSVFADALSVGPAVYSQNYPLILTTPTALSAAAKQQLVDMGVTNVVIVGGTGAVSSAVETAIKGMGITITARLAGTDRTQTAAAIAAWEAATTANGGLQFTGLGTVHISNGADFPDALAAGPVAGASQNVILLAQSPTVLGPGAPTYLSGASAVDTLNALGLTGAVSPAVMSAAAVALAS